MWPAAIGSLAHAPIKEEEGDPVEEQTELSQMVFVKQEAFDFKGEMDVNEWGTQSCVEAEYVKPPACLNPNKANGPRKVIPGSDGVQYASLVAKVYLDKMRQQKISIDKVNRMSVSKTIRGRYKGAWGTTADAQTSKLIRTAIKKAVDDYKKKIGDLERTGQELSEEQNIVKLIIRLDREYQMLGKCKSKESHIK